MKQLYIFVFKYNPYIQIIPVHIYTHRLNAPLAENLDFNSGKSLSSVSRDDRLLAFAAIIPLVPFALTSHVLQLPLLQQKQEKDCLRALARGAT